MTHDYKTALGRLSSQERYIAPDDLAAIKDALLFAERSNLTSSDSWLLYVGGHRVEGLEKLRDVRNFVAGSSSGEVGRYLELCDRLYHIFIAMDKQANSAVESARVGR